MNAQTKARKQIVAAAALAILLGAGSFAYGKWWTHRAGTARASAHTATVYSCPMHPNYHSDHPGDCPMCGMRLEPQAAPGNAPGHASPDGAVQVSPERQQAIGVRVGVVERVSRTKLLRTTGRVTPDENRTYPIVAGVGGWIRKVESVATGDAVKEHQELASFVPPQPEFDSAQQSYYTALEMLYRDASALPGLQPRSQPHGSARADAGIERMADELRNLGVPPRSSGIWRSAAISCRTSAWSRRWTAMS